MSGLRSSQRTKLDPATPGILRNGLTQSLRDFCACEAQIRSQPIGPYSTQVVGSCEAAGFRDPWQYVRDVLTKLSRGWPQSRLDELLPLRWAAATRGA